MTEERENKSNSSRERQLRYEKSRRRISAQKRQAGKRNRRKERKYVGIISIIVLMLICSVAGYAGGRRKERAAVEEAAALASAEETAAEDMEGDDGDSGDDSEAISAVSLDALEQSLSNIFDNSSGIWSLYLKDLPSEQSFIINNQSMYAASLIKLFVMEGSFQNMDNLVSNLSSAWGMDKDKSYEEIQGLMADMISLSDNEAYNELVRLWSSERSFTEGCEILQQYIEMTGYKDTGVYHTLSPSDSEYESTGNGENHTCVEDCGLLLESIYNGTCVSEEASKEMLELLLSQDVVDKIPAGIPDGISVANKTGETDQTQHDVAIVYGEKTDYILCIMSTQIQDEPDVYRKFQDISSLVYSYLNS